MVIEDNEFEILTVIENDGREVDCEIIFTFDLEEYGKNYVVYAPIDNEEDEDESEIHVSSVTPNETGDGGSLSPIEDDEEWEAVKAVVDAYLEEMYEDDDEDEDLPVS